MQWRAQALWLAAAIGGCERSESPEPVVRSCAYTNLFTEAPECREYHGDWLEGDALADCEEQSGALAQAPCEGPAGLGTCVVAASDTSEVRVLFAGDDITQCPVLVEVCGTFLGGEFEAAAACVDHVDDPPPPEDPAPGVERMCVPPLAGEPAGAGPGGQVCTWSAINGCTEEGRSYADYASCEPTYDRGYYPDPPAPDEGQDPRMDDPVYAADVEWVRAQLNACACACCHQGSVTPAGATIFDTELSGNLLNSFSPWGLAFMGGYVDSSIFGSLPPEDNNGFSRDVTGMPTTDTQRALEIFAAELAYRGYATDDDFGPPFGG